MHTLTYTIYITLANTKNVIQLRRKIILNKGIKEKKEQVKKNKEQKKNCRISIERHLRVTYNLHSLQ